MDHSARKLRPLVKWPGGQAYTCRWIISHFREHRVYCEPYGGGLNVLLNKPPSEVEWACDTHPHLANLYGVLQDRVKLGQFCSGLERIEYDEGMFETSRSLLPLIPTSGSVRDALLFYIVQRMSRNGEGKSFSWTKSGRLRGGRHGDVNAWETMRPVVRDIGWRLRDVGISCGRALDLMRRVEGPDTVFYCDPPFPHGSRSSKSKSLYGDHEMSLGQHGELLDYLVGAPARGIYVSTYPNDLYRSVLGGAGWDLDVKWLPNQMATGKDKGKKETWLYFRH